MQLFSVFLSRSTLPFKPARGVKHGAMVAFGLAFIGRHQIDPLRQGFAACCSQIRSSTSTPSASARADKVRGRAGASAPLDLRQVERVDANGTGQLLLGHAPRNGMNRPTRARSCSSRRRRRMDNRAAVSSPIHARFYFLPAGFERERSRPGVDINDRLVSE